MPFLSENSGVRITRDERALHGLVKQCLSEKHPTLAILGAPYKIIPFPLFQDQARFVAAVLTGTVPFAVTPETLRELADGERREREERGVLEKYIHSLGPDQWDYRRSLVKWAGGKAPTDSTREIYEDASKARRENPLGYREHSYVVFGEGSGEWSVSANPSTQANREKTSPPIRSHDATLKR